MNSEKISTWAKQYVDDEKLLSFCDEIRKTSKNYLGSINMETIRTRIYSESNSGNEDSRNSIYKFLSNESEIIIKECILYIQRIRNNLFHGLKDVCSLNDQKQIFDAINCALNHVLEKERE